MKVHASTARLLQIKAKLLEEQSKLSFSDAGLREARAITGERKASRGKLLRLIEERIAKAQRESAIVSRIKVEISTR